MGSSLKSDGKKSGDLEAATPDETPSMASHFIFARLENLMRYTGSNVRGWRRYFKPWSCQEANDADWKIVTRSG